MRLRRLAVKARLAGISDAQIEEHLALYAGYVKQVHTPNQELAETLARGQASGKSPTFAELTRRLGFEYKRMILTSTTPATSAPPPTQGRRPDRVDAGPGRVVRVRGLVVDGLPGHR